MQSSCAFLLFGACWRLLLEAIATTLHGTTTCFPIFKFASQVGRTLLLRKRHSWQTTDEMSLELASQIVVGAEVHRNTSDARVRVSEDNGSKDGGPARPRKGLKCHVKTCDSVLRCLKAVMKHI